MMKAKNKAITSPLRPPRASPMKSKSPVRSVRRRRSLHGSPWSTSRTAYNIDLFILPQGPLFENRHPQRPSGRAKPERARYRLARRCGGRGTPPPALWSGSGGEDPYPAITPLDPSHQPTDPALILKDHGSRLSREANPLLSPREDHPFDQVLSPLGEGASPGKGGSELHLLPRGDTKVAAEPERSIPARSPPFHTQGWRGASPSSPIPPGQLLVDRDRRDLDGLGQGEVLVPSLDRPLDTVPGKRSKGSFTTPVSMPMRELTILKVDAGNVGRSTSSGLTTYSRPVAISFRKKEPSSLFSFKNLSDRRFQRPGRKREEEREEEKEFSAHRVTPYD